MSDQPICVGLVNLDFRRISVDDKKPIKIGAVDHRMRRLHTPDRVDHFVRLDIEHLHKPIRLASKEESVSVQVNGKMVEISLLQSGKWNGLNESWNGLQNHYRT